MPKNVVGGDVMPVVWSMVTSISQEFYVSVLGLV